jgi:hypothetical protein
MSTQLVEERGFEEILVALSEPLPESVIKQRVGWKDASGQEHLVDYIEWYTAADILDRVCPDWSHEIRDIKVIGELVAVTAAITIKGVTRCGVGVGSALDERGIKRAEHDALKRAAIKFGLARELYRGSRRHKTDSVVDLAQKKDSSWEPVTQRQLAAIYAIARAKSLDATLEAMALFQCEPEQLSRSAASRLIDHLKNVRVSA